MRGVQSSRTQKDQEKRKLQSSKLYLLLISNWEYYNTHTNLGLRENQYQGLIWTTHVKNIFWGKICAWQLSYLKHKNILILLWIQCHLVQKFVVVSIMVFRRSQLVKMRTYWVIQVALFVKIITEKIPQIQLRCVLYSDKRHTLYWLFCWTAPSI